jgi:hypothetical protein
MMSRCRTGDTVSDPQTYEIGRPWIPRQADLAAIALRAEPPRRRIAHRRVRADRAQFLVERARDSQRARRPLRSKPASP